MEKSETDPTKSPQSLSVATLKWSGILLIVSGIFHIFVFLIDAGIWEGRVSWRKPILFGISTGLTLWSLSWLVANLRRNLADEIFSLTVAITLVIEVALITLQQWRSTASHFNHSTPFDAVVDDSMLGLICIAVVGIVYFLIRCFGKLNLSPDYALALRSGMCFLVISCVIGFIISAYGYHRVDLGLDPETVGKAGVAKFPHGIAIHALQFLPAIVLVLRWFKVSLDQRVVAVRWVSVSFILQIVFAGYQTLNGFQRAEIHSAIGITLVCGIVISAVIPLAMILFPKRFSRDYV